MILRPPPDSFFFFFNDTATTEIYTLSLHDALPILFMCSPITDGAAAVILASEERARGLTDKPVWIRGDRKSTRLNSSHLVISYAVFCLKKKKTKTLWRYLTSKYLDKHRHVDSSP